MEASLLELEIKAHSKAYKFMFHEAFSIPTFARPKRAKNMNL